LGVGPPLPGADENAVLGMWVGSGNGESRVNGGEKVDGFPPLALAGPEAGQASEVAARSSKLLAA
jgi:hypothetical protein